MSSKPHRCFICQIEFSIADNLYEHIPICRQLAASRCSSALETKTFFCTDCAECFSCFEDLVKHQSDHATDKCECSLACQMSRFDVQYKNTEQDYSLTSGESSHNDQLESSTGKCSLVGGNISQYSHVESLVDECSLDPRESSPAGQLKYHTDRCSIDCDQHSLQNDQLENPPTDEYSLKAGEHSQVEQLDSLAVEYSHKLAKISSDDQVEHPTYEWPHSAVDTSRDAQLGNDTERFSLDCVETSHAGQLENATDIYTSVVSVARSQEAQLQNPECIFSLASGNGSPDGKLTKSQAKSKCQICRKKFNRNYLEQHIRTHTDVKIVKCDLCDRTFVNQGCMKTHMKMKHFGIERRKQKFHFTNFRRYKKVAQADTTESKHEPLPKQFACSYCDKRYVHFSKLEKHEKTHCMLNRYSCPECGVYYFDVEGLQTRRFKKAHAKSCGNLPKSFNHVCLNIPQVRQTFTTTSSFHPSKFQLHTLELQVRNPFVFIECSACCSKVSLREGLYSQSQHQELETNSIPDTDDNIGSQDSNINADTLSSDNKRLRRNRKSYRCSSCGKWFVDEIDLKVHIAHGGGLCLVPSQVNTTTLPPSDTTKIQGGACSICQKVIAKRSDLIKHYRSHSRVMLYECPKCGMKMTDPYSRRKHERSKACREAYKNRKKELHKCAVCGQCFIEKLQLMKHFKLHRGQRKFDCGECGAEFSNPNDLKCHAKVHRKQAAKDKDPTKHNTPPVKKSRSYKCYYCSKQFPIMSRLIRHFRMHTRPFKHEALSTYMLQVLDRDTTRQQQQQQDEIHSHSNPSHKPYMPLQLKDIKSRPLLQDNLRAQNTDHSYHAVPISIQDGMHSYSGVGKSSGTGDCTQWSYLQSTYAESDLSKHQPEYATDRVECSLTCQVSLLDGQLENCAQDCSLIRGENSHNDQLEMSACQCSLVGGNISQYGHVESLVDKCFVDPRESSPDGRLKHPTDRCLIDYKHGLQNYQLENTPTDESSLKHREHSDGEQLDNLAVECSHKLGDGSSDDQLECPMEICLCDDENSSPGDKLEYHIDECPHNDGETSYDAQLENDTEKSSLDCGESSHASQIENPTDIFTSLVDVTISQEAHLRIPEDIWSLDGGNGSHEGNLTKNAAKSECQMCGEKVDCSYLEQHIRAHIGKKPFKCDICDKAFADKANIKAHRKNHFRKEKCKISHKYNFTYKNVTSLKGKKDAHSDKTESKHEHLPKQFACLYCDKRYVYSSTMETHEKRHGMLKLDTFSNDNKRLRRNRKAFKCSDCAKWFADENDLKVHLTHAEGMCSVSSQVNTTTLPPSDATNIQEGVCSICQKVIPKRSDLIKHYRSHSRVMLYECPKCGMKMTDPSSWRKHERSKACREAYKNRKKELHKCAVCGQCFIEKLELKKHFNRHRGQRRFDCGECGAELSNPNDLKRHAKVHRKPAAKNKDPTSHKFKKRKPPTKKSRSYKCWYCSKQFPIMSRLIRHFRMHTRPLKHEALSTYMLQVLDRDTSRQRQENLAAQPIHYQPQNQFIEPNKSPLQTNVAAQNIDHSYHAVGIHRHDGMHSCTDMGISSRTGNCTLSSYQQSSLAEPPNPIHNAYVNRPLKEAESLTCVNQYAATHPALGPDTLLQ